MNKQVFLGSTRERIIFAEPVLLLCTEGIDWRLTFAVLRIFNTMHDIEISSKGLLLSIEDVPYFPQFRNKKGSDWIPKLNS